VDRETDWKGNFMKRIKMQKKLKQKLYFKEYQTNPHGKQTPVFTTSEIYNSPSLPGARKKLK
jgi:hypothetical protein